jgi:hypothetical protein
MRINNGRRALRLFSEAFDLENREENIEKRIKMTDETLSILKLLTNR